MKLTAKIILLTLWSVMMTSCGGSQEKSQIKSPGGQIEKPAEPYWETSEKMNQACAYHIGEAESLRLKLAEVAGPRTEENMVKLFDSIMLHVDKMFGLSELVANVHPEREIREAAEQCQQQVDKFITALSLDRDVYEAFAALDLNQL